LAQGHTLLTDTRPFDCEDYRRKWLLSKLQEPQTCVLVAAKSSGRKPIVACIVATFKMSVWSCLCVSKNFAFLIMLLYVLHIRGRNTLLHSIFSYPMMEVLLLSHNEQGEGSLQDILSEATTRLLPEQDEDEDDEDQGRFAFQPAYVLAKLNYNQVNIHSKKLPKANDTYKARLLFFFF
jgi:hypothetical protein